MVSIPAGEADIDEVHYDVVRLRGFKLSTSLEESLVLENGTAVSVRRWFCTCRLRCVSEGVSARGEVEMRKERVETKDLARTATKSARAHYCSLELRGESISLFQ